ncbi:MAG: FadR family transcriptional regulator, partial [Calditrichaeota bacterium]
MNDLFSRIGNHRTLSQEIEHKIETAILEKKLIAGQKLPTEKELCEMFGVSRTALREALQMLSARGLLYIKKGSGVFVNDFSARHVSRQTAPPAAS